MSLLCARDACKTKNRKKTGIKKALSLIRRSLAVYHSSFYPLFLSLHLVPQPPPPLCPHQNSHFRCHQIFLLLLLLLLLLLTPLQERTKTGKTSSPGLARRRVQSQAQREIVCVRVCVWKSHKPARTHTHTHQARNDGKLFETDSAPDWKI